MKRIVKLWRCAGVLLGGVSLLMLSACHDDSPTGLTRNCNNDSIGCAPGFRCAATMTAAYQCIPDEATADAMLPPADTAMERDTAVERDSASASDATVVTDMAAFNDGSVVAPSCSDDEKNGDESDVDCGGSCSPCAVGLSCEVETDCLSAVCLDGECQVATCFDAATNGDESDVDCGGLCPPCTLGDQCLTADDCDSETCEDGMCVHNPNWQCGNGVIEGAETCDGSAAGDLFCTDQCVLATFECDQACVGAVQRAEESDVWQTIALQTPADAAPAPLQRGGLSFDGMTAVIGLPDADDGAGQVTGHAYVIENVAGEWIQGLGLVAEDTVAGDFFGYSVHVDGDRMIIGAREKSFDRWARVGAAYIFEKINGEWTETAKLLPPEPIMSAMLFGESVIIDGDMAIVGALWQDTLYVYALVDGAWRLAQTLSHEHRHLYPHSFAYDNDILAIKHFEDNVTSRLKIYERNNGRFERTATFGEMLSTFSTGQPVVNQGRVIVGSVVVAERGGAYIFSKENGQWSLNATLIPDIGLENGAAGHVVSIDGPFAILGAPEDNSAGDLSGAIYAFEYIGGEWQYLRRITVGAIFPGEKFGYGLDLSGRRLVGLSTGLMNDSYTLRFLSDIKADVGAPLCRPDGTCLCLDESLAADCAE